MKLVYLKTTIADLRWFKHYYMTVFPESRVRANQAFLATQKLLKANPPIGLPSEYGDTIREHPVPCTPFTFVYRVHGEQIEVLRGVDGRSDWRGIGILV